MSQSSQAVLDSASHPNLQHQKCMVLTLHAEWHSFVIAVLCRCGRNFSSVLRCIRSSGLGLCLHKFMIPLRWHKIRQPPQSVERVRCPCTKPPGNKQHDHQPWKPASPGTMVSIGPTTAALLSLTPCPGSPRSMVSIGPTATPQYR